MFSARRRSRDDGEASTRTEFQRYFAAQGRFTAGVATRYAPSMITAEATFQHLAEGFPVGMRFHSAPVVRLADAKPIQLGHAARADGAWRIYVFADRDDPTGENSRVAGAVRFPGVGRVADRRASPRPAPTPTPSSTSVPFSSRDTATWPSRGCRRSCCRGRAGSG